MPRTTLTARGGACGCPLTDASGQEVNTATPGSHITATDYDRFGNTVRELSAGNRSNAQDLWISLGLAREGRTFPNDPVMVIE